MLVAALGVGLVVRPQRALLAPRLAPGLTSVLTPGLGIGPPRPAPALGQATAPLLARASQLSLSASSEPPELLELPAYPVNIYIEDTDAFAVTYYANYVRFFERAAYAWLGASACGNLLQSEGLLLGVEALDGLKYADAALLGDACEVRGAFTGLVDGVLSLRVALVRAADGKELCSCARLELCFRGRNGELVPQWPLPPPPQLTGGLTMPAAGAALVPPAAQSPPTRLVLQADEASGHGSLSMHAALRYFERHRTAFVGGPDALAALQASGTIVVVARLTQGRLLAAARGATIGDALTLRMGMTLRARGTQVLFEQFLFTAEGELAACAAVTCLCIDPVRGRMVPAPPELQAQLERANLGAN